MLKHDWIAYAREVEDERNRFRNELAESRAQIADLKEHTDAMKEYVATADEMLAEARARIAEKDAEWVEAQKGWSEAIGKVIAERDEARAQIAAYERAAKEGDADPTTGRYTAEDIAHMKAAMFEALPKWGQNELIGLRAQIAALAARHEKALVEGAALLAERDEARAQIAKLEAENKKWVELMERRGELIFGREGD